jgi:hypothetical protein
MNRLGSRAVRGNTVKKLVLTLGLGLAVVLVAGCSNTVSITPVPVTPVPVTPVPVTPVPVTPVPVTPVPVTPTPAPPKVLGITSPVTVQGVSLQFTSVVKELSYPFGTQVLTPILPNDYFLVVTASVLTPNTAFDKVSKWKTSVNRLSVGPTVTTTSPGNVNSITSVIWVFEVDPRLSPFTINLPDGVDVPLDSLYTD